MGAAALFKETVTAHGSTLKVSRQPGKYFESFLLQG